MKLLFLIIAGVCLVFSTSMYAEAKTYENEKYTFEYPNGCKLDKKENRFTTANAQLECKGDAAFQFESGEETSLLLAGESDDELIDDMESAMRENYYTSETVESGADKYMVNNQTAPYILSTYEQEFTNFLGLPAESEDWVMLMVLVKLGNGEHVLVEYINNEDSFDKQLPMAEKIFQSVKGVGNGAGAGTDDSFTSRGNDLPKTSALCDTVTTQSGKDLCEGLLN